MAWKHFHFAGYLWGKSISRLIPITKDNRYGALGISLLLAWTSCWPNSRVTGYMGSIGAHVTYIFSDQLFHWQEGHINRQSILYIPTSTVYPTKYAHGFVVICFVVVLQSFIMNSHEVFIHIHQSCFAGTGAIVRLPQCQWSKPDGYGKISQCITTTKHSKAKTVCIFLGYTVNVDIGTRV